MLTNHWALSVFFPIVIVANGCRPSESPVNPTNGSNGKDIITLSALEMTEAEISTGTFTMQLTESYIACNGTLELPYSSVIQVTPLASGMLKNVTCFPGSFVENGTVLAVLESMDFLKLQQAYLEAKNQLEYDGAALKRQGELTMENASSIKKLEEARRNYQDNEIKMKSLSAQLTLMGIEPDSLDIDNLSSTIEIKAPVSAHVSIIHGIPGKFVSTDEPLFELTRPVRPQLILQVPEEYYTLVHAKQLLKFSTTPGNPMIYRGRLVSVGRYIDTGTKTFNTNAILLNAPELVPGTSVYARIITGKESVASIPSVAIVQDSTGKYIFIKKGREFKRINIQTGETDTIHSQLRNFPSEMIHDTIVTAGIEYLLIRINQQRNIQ